MSKFQRMKKSALVDLPSRKKNLNLLIPIILLTVLLVGCSSLNQDPKSSYVVSSMPDANDSRTSTPNSLALSTVDSVGNKDGDPEYPAFTPTELHQYPTNVPTETPTPIPTKEPILFEEDVFSNTLFEAFLKALANGRGNDESQSSYNVGNSMNKELARKLFAIMFRMDKHDGVPNWSNFDMSSITPNGYIELYYFGAYGESTNISLLDESGEIVLSKDSIGGLGDKMLIVNFIEGKGFVDYYTSIVIGSDWDVGGLKSNKLREFTTIDGLSSLNDSTAKIPLREVGSIIIVDRNKFPTLESFVNTYFSNYEGFNYIFRRIFVPPPPDSLEERYFEYRYLVLVSGDSFED